MYKIYIFYYKNHYLGQSVLYVGIVYRVIFAVCAPTTLYFAFRETAWAY
jgi:hypothetical protein